MAEVVTIKPCRHSSWLPKTHAGYTRFPRTYETLVVPRKRESKIYLTGLTKEEEREFEKELNLPVGTLNASNTEFWSKLVIKVPANGVVFNTSNPENKLKLKVLSVHPRVAVSELERLDKPQADFVVTSVEQEAKIENEKSKLRREAYKVFGNLTIEEMKNILKVVGKRVGDNSSVNFIESQVDKLIMEDTKGFLATVKDPSFKTKVLISDCLAYGILVKSGNKYMLKGGDVIGRSLEDTISYLEDPKNQDVRLDLKAKLDLAQGKKVVK